MDIIQAPTEAQIRVAAEWLAHTPHQNPDLDYVLNLILLGRLPLNQGELLAICLRQGAANVHPPDPLTPDAIGGVLMAGPENWNVSLVGRNRDTTTRLFALVQARGCPRRIATSALNCDWIHPLLLKDYQLEREHTSLVMLCTQVPPDGNGRWAVPEDKPALQASVEADQIERGIRIVPHNWDALIQQKRVAVLDHGGQIVSVMKHGATLYHGMIVGAFTFAPYRRQGFGKQLLSFVLRQLFQDFSAVKLWVDSDNLGAIALYESLDFKAIGSHYTGYFYEDSSLPAD